MPVRPEWLPNFARPPVDEVIVGLQYESIGDATAGLAADYRQRIRTEYPGFQYQPRLTNPMQGQLVVGSPLGQFQAPMPAAAPTNRIWLTSADDSLLIQIQDDRFIHNWRKREGDYPRYELLIERFWHQFNLFRETALQSNVSIHPQFVELSYINWVSTDQMLQSDYFSGMASVGIEVPDLTLRQEPQLSICNYEVEKDGTSIGRLSVQAQGNAIRVLGTSSLRGSVLSLGFVSPLEPGVDDARIADLLHIGRQVIVGGFAQITTPAAHDLWGMDQ